MKDINDIDDTNDTRKDIKNGNYTDENAVKIFEKEIKQYKDVIDSIKDDNAPYKISLQKDIELLEELIPDTFKKEKINEEELKKIIKTNHLTTIKDVMLYFKDKNVDMKDISIMIKKKSGLNV